MFTLERLYCIDNDLVVILNAAIIAQYETPSQLLKQNNQLVLHMNNNKALLIFKQFLFSEMRIILQDRENGVSF